MRPELEPLANVVAVAEHHLGLVHHFGLPRLQKVEQGLFVGCRMPELKLLVDEGP